MFIHQGEEVRFRLTPYSLSILFDADLAKKSEVARAARRVFTVEDLLNAEIVAY